MLTLSGKKGKVIRKPFLVGIAGGSASGKSTFCKELEKELSDLKVKTYHMDDYFKPEVQRPFVEAPFSEKIYMDDNHPETVNLSQLIIDVNCALKSDHDVIIVEGLLTLWAKEIYTNLDLKLFVDCKADERIVRRLRRNMEWGLTFDQIAITYLDMVRYRHDEYVEPTKWRADLVINGSSSSAQAVAVISGYIRSRVTD